MITSEVIEELFSDAIEKLIYALKKHLRAWNLKSRDKRKHLRSSRN